MSAALALLLVTSLIGLAEGADRHVPYWTIAIHGGSGTIARDAPESQREEYRAALSAALQRGAQALAAGGTALDACELVVTLLEDDPHFNAGLGAAFTEAGTHELDASIMDGATLRCGAVAAVQTVRHPISLARAVMERTPHVLLIGSGAEEFADTTTLERVPNSFFSTPRRRQMLEEVLQERRAKEAAVEGGPAKIETSAGQSGSSNADGAGPATAVSGGPPAKGTVGCVARDLAGNLAAATSTGGLTGKRHGRVGDSPIIGAGCYANGKGAVSCTGTGEEFIRHGVARMVVARMELLRESVAGAARSLVGTTLRPDDGGLIAMDAEGNIAMAYSSEGMYRGSAAGTADRISRMEVGVFEECAGIHVAAAPRPAPPSPRTFTGLNGTLLCIGGGLDEQNEPVLRRLGELTTAAAAARGVPARLLIATTASGDEDGECLNILAGIQHFCPELVIERIGRSTPRDDAVRLIDSADGMFFTGGDQKRITALYRPDGIDTPEATAMRRLLERGGVIAGTSAGDAMMGETMFRTGRSAEALGISSTRRAPGADDDPDQPQPTLGPQLDTGMAFEPWALTDSHFTERHRIGRLVAALECSGIRLGIGVSENACVEFDLADGVARAIGDSSVLLVDVGPLRRIDSSRTSVRAQVLRQGDVVDLNERARSLWRWGSPPEDWPRITIDSSVPGVKAAVLEAALYSTAQTSPGSVARLELDGWYIEVWADPTDAPGRYWLTVGALNL